MKMPTYDRGRTGDFDGDYLDSAFPEEGGEGELEISASSGHSHKGGPSALGARHSRESYTWKKSDSMYIMIVQKKYGGDPRRYALDLIKSAGESSEGVKVPLCNEIRRVMKLFRLDKDPSLVARVDELDAHADLAGQP
jgi:hypothetical protein